MKKQTAIIAVVIIAIIIPIIDIAMSEAPVLKVLTSNLFYITFPIGLILLILSYYSWKEKKNIHKTEIYISAFINLISWIFLIAASIPDPWVIDPAFFLNLAYFSSYAIASGMLMRRAKQINNKDNYWKKLGFACILSFVGIPITFLMVETAPVATCYLPMIESNSSLLAAPIHILRKNKLKSRLKKEGRI